MATRHRSAVDFESRQVAGEARHTLDSISEAGRKMQEEEEGL